MFHVLTALIILSPAAEAASSLPNFHFVLPTRQASFNPGRHGTFNLEFRNAPFSEMKSALEKCKAEGILPNFGNHAPILYIYLPDTAAYLQYRDRLAEEARDQFESAYPGVELQIKFRVVHTNIHVTYIYSRVKELLQNLREKFAADPQAKEYVDALERTNEEAYQETQHPLEVTAPTARRVKYSLASARFFIVAAARTLQTLPALSGDSASMSAAMALIVTDASVEFFNVAFTQKIQRLFASFPVRDFKTPLRTRIGQFINNSLWNLVFFSVGRPMTMQFLAHISDPDIPNPDSASLSNVLGWSSVGVLFYTTFTNGYNTLRDKGWVSASQIDMALQVSGMFDLATGILNSNPNWYFYRLFTWGPQWSFYAAVGLLAKLAPRRADRILAIDSSIRDWSDVHEEQVTDASWHINGETDFLEARDRFHEIERTHGPCEEIYLRKRGGS